MASQFAMFLSGEWTFFLSRARLNKTSKEFQFENFIENTEEIKVRFLVYNTIMKYECVVAAKSS